jgi:hypothetical protein
MTDTVADLAELDQQRTMPLPTPEQLTAWADEDRALVPRIRAVRPGVPALQVYAVLQALHTIRHLEGQAGAPEPEHCVHSAAIHQQHHTSPVTGCPWCSAPTTRDVPTGGLT